MSTDRFHAYQLSEGLRNKIISGDISADENSPIITNLQEVEALIAGNVAQRLAGGELPIKSFIRFDRLAFHLDVQNVTVMFSYKGKEMFYIGPYALNLGDTLIANVEGKMLITIA